MRKPCTLTNTEAAARGLSRTTAWRSRNRGWVRTAAPLPERCERKMVAPAAAPVNADAVLESAHAGARRLWNMWGLQSSVAGLEFDDLLGAACLRLLEVAGHPAFDNAAWRNAVAFNACRNAATKEWRARRRWVGMAYAEISH